MTRRWEDEPAERAFCLPRRARLFLVGAVMGCLMTGGVIASLAGGIVDEAEETGRYHGYLDARMDFAQDIESHLGSRKNGEGYHLFSIKATGIYLVEVNGVWTLRVDV